MDVTFIFKFYYLFGLTQGHFFTAFREKGEVRGKGERETLM